MGGTQRKFFDHQPNVQKQHHNCKEQYYTRHEEKYEIYYIILLNLYHSSFANQLNQDWQIYTRLNNCVLPIITHFMCLRLEKTSSSLYKIMISCNSLLESHFDGNYYLLQIFQLITKLFQFELCCDWLKYF